jgi:hypothetical protein
VWFTPFVLLALFARHSDAEPEPAPVAAESGLAEPALA